MLDRIPKRYIDLIVTAVVLLATVPAVIQRPALGIPALTASSIVFWRRTHPLLTLGVAIATNLVAIAFHERNLLPVTLIAFYTVAESLPRREALRLAGLALVPLAVAVTVANASLSSVTGSVIPLALAWLVGDNVRARRERVAGESAKAVAAERTRIARELHDMVTHNVSVMVVQAAAGNDVIDTQPEQARAAFRAVEETGRRALGELRALLDVVADDGDAAFDPQPGLERLDSLVDSVRATGLGVDVTVEGTPRELPRALELSAFRIVQESLTNTLKHARASRASVRVRYAPDALELEVADDGVGALSTDGGRGLVGMRERVALFGGDLSAGSRPSGGFAVRARMPVEAA